ncbi:uncharacterized protein LOC112680128 [Sipha flava]|uniref:Uncharacterized protein LOC112680128 n=1 Tax=Sipha flava TaxID=143950 RepID=A0A8B8F6G5_9HEMI|nr:uncharacterized protein LOC112680128 [Sipha flava]XP_025405916.1 uncharacterized protein LOC112680128 [Sipha flava]XP_025405917.1 uncharacterized protein LOC112680128 [Sipha flava]
MAFEIKNPGKPRQVRGTNAYKYRNLFVFGVFAFSGLSWFLFEQLPTTKRLKEKIYSGYWDRTPEDNYRLEMIKRNLNPDMKDLMAKRAELSKKEPIVPIKV